MREDIKDLLKNCKTEEEAMAVLKDQNIEVSDEELEELRGGSFLFAECIGFLTEIIQKG